MKVFKCRSFLLILVWCLFSMWLPPFSEYSSHENFTADRLAQGSTVQDLCILKSTVPCTAIHQGPAQPVSHKVPGILLDFLWLFIHNPLLYFIKLCFEDQRLYQEETLNIALIFYFRRLFYFLKIRSRTVSGNCFQSVTFSNMYVWNINDYK